MEELKPLEEALAVVLNSVKPLEEEVVSVHASLGRFLAEKVQADTDKPLFDNSAMDGFAVRAVDIKGASADSPVKLRLVGEFSAGAEGNFSVVEGSAVKIFTGAPIPEGADTVVPVEYTEVENSYVYIKKELPEGANVRRKGEDVRQGDVVLEEGSEIRPYELGILASVNKAMIRVRRKPRVAILSTGDELLEIGEAQNRTSQIRSSNHHMLYGFVREAGGEPCILGIAPDEPDILTDLLKTCYSYDVFITTGGVSMGEKDYVQYLVEKVGIDVKFHRLRIKPAKPVLFGTYGEKGLFFGLPGNPVSCAVAFDLLVYPALRLMAGARSIFKQKAEAVLVKGYRRKDAKRREFVRARVWFQEGHYLCEPLPKQHSHMLTSYVGANAYLIVYEGVHEIREGDRAEIVLL